MLPMGFMSMRLFLIHLHISRFQCISFFLKQKQIQFVRGRVCHMQILRHCCCVRGLVPQLLVSSASANQQFAGDSHGDSRLTAQCSLLLVPEIDCFFGGFVTVSLSLSLSPEVVSKMVTLLWNWMADLWWPQLTYRRCFRRRQPCCWRSGGTMMTSSLILSLTSSCSRPLKHSSQSCADHVWRKNTSNSVSSAPEQWSFCEAHTSSDTWQVAVNCTVLCEVEGQYGGQYGTKHFWYRGFTVVPPSCSDQVRTWNR